jgi:hypothetical protein
MSTRYYVIRTHPYIFHASVIKANRHEYKIKFGGKIGCVSMTVYTNDLYPHLDGLRADKDCVAYNEEQPSLGLMPSSGTLRMAKAAIRFMYSLFPNQRDIQLNDASKVKCEGHNMNLAHYYMVKHLQTWYQAKFAAVPIADNDKLWLANLANFIKSPYKEATFDEFMNAYIVGRVSHHDIPKLEKKIRPAFNRNATYHAFFKDVADQYDCDIFKDWLVKFIQSNTPLTLDGMRWVILKDVAMTFPEVGIVETDEVPAFITHRKPVDFSYMYQYGGSADNVIPTEYLE